MTSENRIYEKDKMEGNFIYRLNKKLALKAKSIMFTTAFVWLYMHFFMITAIMVEYVPAFETLPVDQILKVIGLLVWLVYILIITFSLDIIMSVYYTIKEETLLRRNIIKKN